MLARSHSDLHAIRASVETVRKISDRAIGLGKFGVGLDGVLAMVPVAGAAYSFGAAAMILIQAVRARASVPTIASMTAILFADTALDVVPVPIAPGLVDILFTGHKWASDLLLKHMDDTLYYEATRAAAEADPAYRQVVEQMRASGDRRRIVFLHD